MDKKFSGEFPRKKVEVKYSQKDLEDQVTICSSCLVDCHVRAVAKYLKEVSIPVFLEKQKTNNLPQDIRHSLRQLWVHNVMYKEQYTCVYNILDPKDKNYLGKSPNH